MYEKIRSTNSLSQDYGKRLIEEGVITQEIIDKTNSQIEEHFEQEYKKS